MGFPLLVYFPFGSDLRGIRLLKSGGGEQTKCILRLVLYPK